MEEIKDKYFLPPEVSFIPRCRLCMTVDDVRGLWHDGNITEKEVRRLCGLPAEKPVGNDDPEF